MNKRAALLVVLASLAGYPSVSLAEPYDLRGIQLGMTLEAFRALPYPDKADTDYDVKVICAGDPEASDLFELNTRGPDGEAGVRKCSF